MPEKPSDTKTFAHFLEQQPAPAETVTLTGYAVRSSRTGSFSFTTGGQTVELPVDAVKSHKVLNEGPQQLLELQVQASKIDNQILKSIIADGHKPPHVDTIKETITDHISDKFVAKDPVLDPGTLPEHIFGPPESIQATQMQPFVLATPHHAPASAITAQMGGVSASHQFTLAHLDATLAALDRHTFKELVKDPIFDQYTLPETVVPDPTNTAAEGIGSQQGQNVVPEMYTRAMGGANPIASLPAYDILHTAPVFDPPHTVPAFDTPRTVPISDHPYTLKEIAKDPLADVYSQITEYIGGNPGGGTIQEGVGVSGYGGYPVWNLPGMMF
jgi:hypothetical protein